MTFCVCRICKTSGQVRTSRKPVNFIAIPISLKLFNIWVCTKCHSRLKEYFEGLKNEN